MISCFLSFLSLLFGTYLHDYVKNICIFSLFVYNANKIKEAKQRPPSLNLYY